MKAKKNLGQHFLTDENIAKKIVDSLNYKNPNSTKTLCIEIGPGKGVLTKYLLERQEYKLNAIEFDKEAIEYLNTELPDVSDKIIQSDVLEIDFQKIFKEQIALIGNIPYNITAPIFFQILDNKTIIPQAVMMIQKEVAQRIAAPPGSKVYGILSVLLQAFYKIEYLFTVDETVFEPPPKVKSAVIRLERLENQPIIENWLKFKNIVKAAFNQRRKTIRNSLGLYDSTKIPSEFLQKRAEQLSVEDFLKIYNSL